jgi:hypothetical protein
MPLISVPYLNIANIHACLQFRHEGSVKLISLAG